MLRMGAPGRIWVLWSKWYYYMIRCWVLGTGRRAWRAGRGGGGGGARPTRRSARKQHEQLRLCRRLGWLAARLGLGAWGRCTWRPCGAGFRPEARSPADAVIVLGNGVVVVGLPFGRPRSVMGFFEFPVFFNTNTHFPPLVCLGRH
jgi:hypothetical protein